MKKTLLGLIIFLGLFILILPQAHPQEDTSWQSMSTKFTKVLYENSVDFKRLNKRLSVGPIDPASARLLKYSNDPKETVAKKIDLIFNKAQQILDMYPANTGVTIKIYKRLSGLHNEYQRIFNQTSDIVSFYIYKYNTVYVAEEIIQENILAHELAHSIIDHYFMVMPPRKIQELLATYVDLHLDD